MNASDVATSATPVGATLTARAAVGDGDGAFALAQVDVDPPRAGEIRVRLAAAGLCHTDHDSLRWGMPLVLGHEGAGVVVDVGPGVERCRAGDRVLLNWAIPCGVCRQCLSGHPVLCEQTRPDDPAAPSNGHAHRAGTRWRGEPVERAFNLGTLSEVTLVREAAVTRIPDELPMDSACIIGCSVMTGVGSVLNVARVACDESVVVIGCGGVGQNVIQGARIAGARPIIAVDVLDSRLDSATRLGASHCLRAADGDSGIADVAADVRRLTGGRGADYAFEATGRPTLAFAPLAMIRHGGMAVQVSGSHAPASVNLSQFMWNKTYVTPLYGDCRPERDFPLLFGYHARGTLELGGLITHRYALDGLADAFADMLAGRGTKGVIEFDPRGTS